MRYASRKSALTSHQPGIQRTLRDHGHGLVTGVSRDMPVYCPNFRQVLIPACIETGSGLGLGLWLWLWLG